MSVAPYPRGEPGARSAFPDARASFLHGNPVLIALVGVAIFAIIGMGIVAELGHRAARHAADQTRAQAHSALVDERTMWVEAEKAWHEERKMLLDRLSDREGRQVAVFQPLATPEPAVERRDLPWDEDLQPFDFEKAAEGGDEG